MFVKQLLNKLFRATAPTQAFNAPPLFRAGARPFDKREAAACRDMLGLPLAPEKNPGIRVSGNYVTDEEAAELVQCALMLKEKNGFVSCEDDVLRHNDASTLSSSPFKMIAERVTGRPESALQRPASWGYGDAFRASEVPEPLRKLAAKIAKDTDYFGSGSNNSSSSSSSSSKNDDDDLLRLRDITINYRSNSMFRLDPHVDPALDGANVFIIGLLSDVVLTFSPPTESNEKAAIDSHTHTQPEPLLPSVIKMRTTPAAIALQSWTDADIDVLLQKKDLVHFTGHARYPWRHAIRTGVEVGGGAQTGGESVVCDWFGNLNTLMPRQKQRISIVLAFK